MAHLELGREQVLAYRRRVGHLEERLARSAQALEAAARPGLTDSVPRAALLSLHARVEGITPATPYEPPFVQVWGPRYSVHVVAERDRGVFTAARRIADERRRLQAEDVAERLDAFLAGREMLIGEASRSIGEHHHMLRYASTTGRLLIRWDGARQPTVRTVPHPEIDPVEARLELARRYLHALGPGTVEGFGDWAGLRAPSARAAFEGLRDELVPVRTEDRDGWALAADEAELRTPPAPSSAVRLLPSGDAYYLLWGPDRALLVPDVARRAELWTSRVWPGAVLVAGDVVGTWRRAEEKVSIAAWRTLTADEREAVEREAVSLPLPGLTKPITVRWDA
ncbi:winged helix DNA-binding domain-containing protein [Actinotalea ferrariae]|uniref:DNA glycosylase AlkZ-like family protein n=1 Tax=Actinotalea ferrariae TaxID=1386098 RepID=UPI001C8BCE7D|nr:crosslink repair DNA glycosylase YcaQ family protein [Actinotalea ferrariae]MBX9244967.1 winged helix DNA-binding domain-containing protein [Actinotalea ferrariae]